MEFRVLGPLEAVDDDGGRLDLGGHRQQIVLASLALEPRRVISVGRLVTAVYGERLPNSARAQVQICVSALRRLLAANGRPEAITTRHQGYALEVPDDDVDLQRYESLLGRAGATADKDEAVRLYREALRMWRGAPLEGLDSEPLRAAADRLVERRLAATEECIDFELALGRHDDVIAELTGLVAAHPLRERLRGQLMLALYRSGRQAEALECYRSARRILIEDLGLEPSERLQRLERSILGSDIGLDAPLPPERIEIGRPVVAEPVGIPPPVVIAEQAAPDGVGPPLPAADGKILPVTGVDPILPVAGVDPILPVTGGGPKLPVTGVGVPLPVTGGGPSLLPTDIADFTGRTDQIQEIQERLAEAAENPAQLAVPIVVVAGKPGIGKTSLCVHVAHRIAWRYPDGQLFADLHGGASRQASPTQVLERFLRGLGVPGNAIPDELEERAEMYRDLLADRRILVVLDNAGSETQLLPLLPGNPSSAVLVTSRRRLAGLPGAVHIEVDVFDSVQSIALLSRIAGGDRVQAEADAAAELAELCGQLPLALRIAGARLSARPHWTVEQLASRLENESRRLDELKHGALGIRVSISLTYDNLADEARRLFRRLALLDFPAFGGWVSAALLDQPLADAQDLLDELVDAQLVEITGTEGGLRAQYRLHDLIRVFARERLAVEEGATDRSAALSRVLGALLFLAEQAHERLHGCDTRQVHSQAERWTFAPEVVARVVRDPLGWLERERLNLVAAVRQTVKVGLVELCWDLAFTSVTLFESRIYLDDWRETHRVALAACRSVGDQRGEAVMLYSTGSLGVVEKRFTDARENLEQSERLFKQLGAEHGVALVSRQLAYLDRIASDFDNATRRYESALHVLLAAGDLTAAAYVLNSMAQTALERGNPEEAKRMLPRALELSRQAGSRRVEAQVLHRLADAHLSAGDHAAAVTAFDEALTVVRDLGDPIGQAYALHGLGLAHLCSGDHDQAGRALTEARGLAASTGERMIEARVERSLGELDLAVGKAPQAVVHLHRALSLFRSIQAPRFEARVLVMLSEAYAAAGGGDQPYAEPAESEATAAPAHREMTAT
ncbi:BTAD domain-containing putative transcriptional regulator [Verrucosispora sp. WMMC514]|uniref:AfsR/SARP family transcriptional regulator n=1 Tax=Verrucosispora sp. WMMC514 TaxID=3015156 RepID=UPI00248BB27A|nr:BTAD domain-containing putative transcriptional regulator [Verrucosispora sp. WMMC514]WBB91148.1 BTAD domain-containing putative transcriptional regulator [Verrucosispora sp. WMMC514]